MKKYLLDTNSLIYALNRRLQIPLHDYLVSVITEIELLSYSKLSSEDEEAIKALLSNFTIIILDEEIKEQTIAIRKAYKLKLPDSIIVASAIKHNATLVTSDKQLLRLDCLEAVDLVELIER